MLLQDKDPEQTLTITVPDRTIDADLILIRARLTETVKSLTSDKLNAGKLELKPSWWKGAIGADSAEFKALSLWISESKDVEGLKTLSKFMNVLLDPKKHISIASLISSNENARKDENEAHKVVANWIKQKIKTAMETPVLEGRNPGDSRLSRLNSSFNNSLSRFIG